jgi:hypothetical protein
VPPDLEVKKAEELTYFSINIVGQYHLLKEIFVPEAAAKMMVPNMVEIEKSAQKTE